MAGEFISAEDPDPVAVGRLRLRVPPDHPHQTGRPDQPGLPHLQPDGRDR